MVTCIYFCFFWIVQKSFQRELESYVDIGTRNTFFSPRQAEAIWDHNTDRLPSPRRMVWCIERYITVFFGDINSYDAT